MELEQVLERYINMAESGLYPWQSPYCTNNRCYFYSLGVTAKFMDTADIIRKYHCDMMDSENEIVTRKSDEVCYFYFSTSYILLHLTLIECPISL